MRTGIRRLACLCVTLLLTAATAAAAAAQDAGQKPYDSYTYSMLDGQELASPAPYLPDRVVRGDSFGLNSLKNPRDLYIDETTGMLLIADTGNNRVIITDVNFSAVSVVSAFGPEGQDAFKEPSGVFYAADGLIYVADTGNQRLVCLNLDGTLHHLIPKPESPLLGENFIYTPVKVGVSSLGNIYVVSEGVYQGILEIGQDGSFLGYAGMNKVVPSLWDRFWRLLSTKEQRSSMAAFIPVSFNNLDIDESDFILATAQIENNAGSAAVKRINPSGKDVLRVDSPIPLVGDVGNTYVGSIVGPSRFVDIASMKGGIYACVDVRRSRIFMYDSDGYMMMAFSFTGGQDGLLTAPAAIDSYGSDLYVLDGPQNAVTVFKPTEYGRRLINATALYYYGDYDQATEEYEEVYRLNTNCELAYTGIGKAQLREGNFKEAMTSFRLANNKTLYSRAFSEYRQDLLSGNFLWVFLLAFAALAVVVIRIPIVRLRARREGAAVKVSAADDPLQGKPLGRYLQSVDYAFYYIFHPFKGANDLKREKRGTVAGALTLTLLYVLTMMGSSLLSGYLFRTGNVNRTNVLLNGLLSLLPLILWCVANWCLTTLMDGEGSFRDIFISAAYSLTPFILIQIPLIAVSNLLTLEESAFYAFFYILSLLWLLVLLLVGNMTIHNVSMKRALGTALLTVVGMVVILVLGFLLVNLAYTVFEFGRTIYRELIFRM